MAIFKILKGPSSRISTSITPFNEGYAYFTPDNNGFYIDAETESGVQTRFHVNAASVSAVSATLLASGWSNGEQTVAAAGVTATSNGMISLAESATSTQYNAAQDAGLMLTAQGAGTVTVSAMNGTAPTVDIPILILLFD